jgi:pimeloyl-ACP methyl ester carboxylesterase/DNA-binding winged helix-turn-helix (wHTH) protein
MDEAPVSPAPGGTHRLAAFSLDLDRLELRDATGAPVPLRPQSLAVLDCLARHAGALVSKEALLHAVWPDVVVTEDSLVQCIKEIRRALHDDEHRLVRTEVRRGYRLVGLAPADDGDAEPAFAQEIRFATTRDGVRIAYALSGPADGLPLVRAAHWMTHLDCDWRDSPSAPRIRAWSQRYRLLRYDGRGWGLSDRDCGTGGPDEWQADLEAVVDAAGLRRFALFGMSGGAAISIRYAAHHPERVCHLVLMGGFAQGPLRRGPRATPLASIEAMQRLILDGWGQDNDAFRQLMTSQLWPGASISQMRAFNHLQRMASSPQAAAAMLRAMAEIDVVSELAGVRCPTLVAHSRDDARAPFEEGRRMAAAIPGARLEALETGNHTPLPGEPAYAHLNQLIDSFLQPAPGQAQPVERRAPLRVVS